MFAIFADDPPHALDGPARVLSPVSSMRTLRRIHAASQHIAPHWLLCVFFGAYVTLQVATPSGLIG
jgi:hypothetical protein